DKVEKGHGSFATRGTVVGGNAAWGAAKSLKEKLLNAASAYLDIQVQDLNFRGETFINQKDEILLDLDQLLSICKEHHIESSEKYTSSTDHMYYPYGVRAAETDMDPDRGKINILKYHITYDLGRMVNPTIVKGQLVGGMAQGLGGTLYDGMKYDDSGQLVSGTFMDYILPTSMEVPEVTVGMLEDEPSPLNELGVKGAGEGGTVAVAPAVVNAIENALQNDSMHLTSLPIRPEKIRAIIKENQKKYREVSF